MKYYKDNENKIYEDPIRLFGLIEIEAPIFNGIFLKRHKDIHLVTKDSEGKYFKYYLSTMVDGMYVADLKEELKKAQENKISEFKIKYLEAANKIFTYKNNHYKGGESSASAIAGAINLAQALGESNCKIVDANDKSHDLTFGSAATLSASIAKQWRDTFYKYKALKLEINAATNESELDLILWT